MKESTKHIAKMILDKHDIPTKGVTQPMTEAMLDYINVSKSGIPTFIMELNRREG